MVIEMIIEEKKRHGYWIPHKVEDKKYISGYRYLPSADCSICGTTTNLQKPICPHCGAIMDAKPDNKE